MNGASEGKEREKRNELNDVVSRLLCRQMQITFARYTLIVIVLFQFRFGFASLFFERFSSSAASEL